MVTRDTKTNPLQSGSTSSHDSHIVDSDSASLDVQPPSYDLAISHTSSQGLSTSSSFAQAGPSSSSSRADTSPRSSIPEHLAHLFEGPPNAESLVGRETAPLNQHVEEIVLKKFGDESQTWDSALADPATLYEFVRRNALKAPCLKLHVLGAHFETAQRTETVFVNGVAQHRNQGQTQRIVDFDFTVDLTQLINHEETLNNVHLYTIQPDEAVQRGTPNATFSPFYAPPNPASIFENFPQCLTPPTANPHSFSLPVEDFRITDAGRVASWSEIRAQTKFLEWRRLKGLPSWIGMNHPKFATGFWKSKVVPLQSSFSQTGGEGQTGGGGRLRLGDDYNHDNNVIVEEEERLLDDLEGTVDTGDDVLGRRRQLLEDAKTRQSLRQWCEAYCSSPGIFKSFQLDKEVWGWDTEGLITAIKGAVLSTGYQSNEFTVKFEVSEAKIVIKPDNTFSKWLGTPWIFTLLWITLIYPLIYPFIWIWQRLHPLGGAKFNIARASYALKFYPPLPETYPTETISQATHRLPSLYKLHPQLPATPVLQKGPRGIHYLVGKKEGEWFREWEDRIRMAVRLRFKGELEGGFQRGEEPNLDGY